VSTDKADPATGGSHLRQTYPGYCSFCRKSYKEVGPLVQGPDEVYICYQCVLLSKDIIEKECRRRNVSPKASEGHGDAGGAGDDQADRQHP
jgi:hypothetical protein